jgi:DNA-binding XRE family transcriptional regulator
MIINRRSSGTKMQTENVDAQLREKLKDPNFKRLYGFDRQKLTIVKLVIDYRIRNKLSQKELADKAGITERYISKIESGEFSGIATLQKILLCIGYRVKIQAVPLKV